jgi:hypothetical protein
MLKAIFLSALLSVPELTVAETTNTGESRKSCLRYRSASLLLSKSFGGQFTAVLSSLWIL